MKRFVALSIVVLAGFLLAAAPASAGQLTFIQHVYQGIDYYQFTPPSAGTLEFQLDWTRPGGSGAPVYPEAEVDVVVQGYEPRSGEPYAQLDYAAPMMWPYNPWLGSLGVTGARVGKPVYFGVVPWIGDVPYRLRVWFTPTSDVEALVIDTAGPEYPGEDWAYGGGGMFHLGATSGQWHSVIQYWKGTPADAWANWDDFALGRDGMGVLAANQLVSYVPPVVTDTVIPGSGPYAAHPGWYVAAPQLWTAAARPNVWGNYTYLKPGSLTWSACPAWYTYSFPDMLTVVTPKPTYFWGTVSTSSADGRSYSASSQRSESLAYQFYGPSFTWIYTTGPKCGISSVKVDGVEVAQIDTYSASVTPKASHVFSGFGATAAHTVVIQNVSKNPASGGTWTYHDAFIAPTDAADPVPTAHRQNDADGSTTYAWGPLVYAGASGGTVSACKSTSGALAYTFNKTVGLNSFTWKYLKGPRAGIWNVLVDGKVLAAVNMYAASTVPAQQFVDTSSLPNGLHTILVLNDGKDPASLGAWCYHDAFVIGGVTIED